MNNIKKENRNRLFFNKFKYKSTFNIEGAYYVQRCRTVSEMMRYIKDRDQEIRSGVKYYNNRSLSHMVGHYADFIEWRNRRKGKMSIRTTGNTASVFTNELSVLRSLEKLDIAPVTHVEVNIECPPDVMMLVNPKHNYRVYFKQRLAKDGFQEELTEFFKNRPNSIFPCGALKRWARTDIKQPRYYSNWTQSSHFMEFDDESMLTLIKLYFGDIVGKYYKIEKRPEQS